MRKLMSLAGFVLLVMLSAGAVLVVGMRRKSPRVQRAVRSVNRAFWNPRALVSAGSAGSTTSVVEHVGRRSGQAYRTPVDAIPTDDGFLVALPYGTGADWVRNVVAAGSATVVHDGARHAVAAPKVVPMADVVDRLPASTRRALRMFNVTECLQLSSAAAVAPPIDEAPTVGA